MSELLAGLFFIALGVGILAVIGRALWALIAWFARAFINGLRALGFVKTRRCRWCAAEMPPLQFRCCVCHLPDQRNERNLIGALQTIERLHRGGQLDDAQHAQLTKLVGSELALACALVSQPTPAWVLRALEEANRFELEKHAVRELVPLAEPVVAGAEPVTEPAAAEPVAATLPPLEGALAPVAAEPARALGAEVPPELEVSRDVIAPEVTVAPAPRRALGWKTLLHSFMEEKNIRWGELVGGMLIVGCSVGLVVSLWATLQQAIPYFPALLFMGLTAAIHGAGVYTLRHWKLESTSRGLLLVASLLAPLNFMTLVILARQRPEGDPFFWISGGVALVLFGGMTAQAGRVLAAELGHALLVGVLGGSFAQLVVSRAAGPELSDVRLWSLAAVPLVAYLAAFLSLVASRWRHPTLDAEDARKLFVGLGTGTFAFLLAEGLLVHLVLGELAFGAERLLALRIVLGRLSPLVNLAAVPALVLGLVLHRRITDRALAAERTIGTTLAMLGVGVLVLAVMLAWPVPVLVLAVGTVNFLLLTIIAAVCGLALLHVPAVACAALAVLIGVHHADLLTGALSADSEPLRHALLSGRSALVLVALAGICTVVGAGLRQAGRVAAAEAYQWNAAGLAAGASALALHAGFWSLVDVDLTTPVFALVGAGLLVANLRLPRLRLGYLSSGLLFVALVHAAAWNSVTTGGLVWLGVQPRYALMAAALAHASLSAVAAALLAVRALGNAAEWAVDRRCALGVPFSQTTVASALLALPWILLVLPGDATWAAALLAFWIVVLWVVLAVLYEWPGASAAVQVLLATSALFAATAVCQRFDWWQGIVQSGADPRFLQAQGAGLLLVSLLLLGARLAASAWGRTQALLEGAPRLDGLFAGTVVVGLVGVSAAGCLPGLRAEWGLPEPGPVFGPGIDHAAAFGWGAWGLLALTFVTLMFFAANAHVLASLVGAIVAGVAIPCLIAGLFDEQRATASALRWGVALYALALSVLVASARFWTFEAFWRLRARVLRRLASAESRPAFQDLLTGLRVTTLVVSLAPILLLTIVAMNAIGVGQPSAGPAESSVFALVPPAASLGMPLFLMTLALVILAAPDRAAGLVFVGGLVALLATTATLLAAGRAGADIEPAWYWHCNVITAASFALIWWLLRRWLTAPRPSSQRYLGAQMALGPLGTLLLAVVAVLVILVRPDGFPPPVAQIGGPLAHVGLLLSAAGLVAYYWRRMPEHSHWLAAAGGLCASALLAVAMGPISQPSNWLCYHVLSGAWLGVGWFLAAGGWLLRSTDLVRWEAASRRWIAAASTVAGLVLLLILRGVFSDPVLWWSSAASLMVTLLIAVIGLRERSQAYAYASTALLVIAVTLAWLGPLHYRFGDSVMRASLDWLMTVVAAAAAAGGWWQGVELWHQRRRNTVFDHQSGLAPVHRPVLWSSLIAAGIVAAYALTVRAAPVWADPIGFSGSAVSNAFGWTMLLAIGALAALNLWDRTAPDPLAAMYTWGLVSAALVVDACGLQERWVVFAGSVAAAAYLLITSVVWSGRAACARVAERLGIPDANARWQRAGAWLSSVTLLLACGVLATGLWTVLSFPELWCRLAAAGIGLVVALALASQADGPARPLLQGAALLALAVAAVQLGWGIMPVEPDRFLWLHRSIRLIVVLAAVGFLYGVVLVRLRGVESDWLAAVRRAGAVVGAGAVIALLATLAMEALWYQPAPDRIGAPVTGPQIAVVALALVGLVATCISLALLPGSDPLGLSQRGRMLYVYAAELVAALLFVHVYLTMPWLFSGYLRPYWPLIVMAIAFVGVGLAELFERLQLTVLAEPLKTSGAFLPILPVLGFWIYASQTDYSTLLLSVGLLYGVLAATQQSFGFALMAALAGNGGLWAMFQERGQAFYEHPQLWLIPPAVSVLAAAQLNRDRLAAAQLAAIRYLAVVTIYASSTADMFLTGVGESLWLPMILAALSVAGIFCGILLRVRAFLYLGAAFLFLSLVAMVYHAHRHIDHVWPWWAFGITMGIGILALFGVFEKKRNEVVALVETLKQWDR